MKKESGITLVALIITVTILLIIATVAIKNSIDTINDAKLQGFYMELEVIQKRVDEIAALNENYLNETTGEPVYIMQQGIDYSNLDATKQEELQYILDKEGSTLDINKFKYFTIEDIEDYFDIEDTNYNLFIEFDSRTVIAEEGIKIGNETYYMLENEIYFVEQTNKDKNKIKDGSEIPELTYTITDYGEKQCKIKVSPNKTIGDLGNGGTVKYKLSTSNYWNKANNLEMIISNPGTYTVEYEDLNNNKIEETINIEYSLDRLPKEYQEVEYLNVPAKSKIQLGIFSSDNPGFYIKYTVSSFYTYRTTYNFLLRE